MPRIIMIMLGVELSRQVFFEPLPEREQLAREPRPLPQMHLTSAVKDIFEFRFEDFELQNYDPHPAIKAPVAV